MEEKTVDGRSLSRELDVVKKALVGILQEENPLPLHQQQARDDELSRRLSSHDGSSSSPSHTLDPHDLSILSRLLHQVKLLEQEDGEVLPMKLQNLETSASYNGLVSSERNMVDTVVQIASAAAEAAKAAAAASGKNLEVMETLLSSSEKTTQHRHIHSGSHDEASNDEKISRPPFPDKDLAKKIERQNRFTHYVLGFMVVATAIWRFKLLSMFIGVRKTFSNPFQAIGDMVSEGFKGGTKEDQSGAKGFHKARTVLPSILGGEEREVSKKLEEKEQSTTEDFKIGEALTLSLDNILSVGKLNNVNDSEDPSNSDVFSR